jgi:hypothetical protein
MHDMRAETPGAALTETSIVNEPQRRAGRERPRARIAA